MAHSPGARRRSRAPKFILSDEIITEIKAKNAQRRTLYRQARAQAAIDRDRNQCEFDGTQKMKPARPKRADSKKATVAHSWTSSRPSLSCGTHAHRQHDR